MLTHTRRCFGSRDVSEKERRLLFHEFVPRSPGSASDSGGDNILKNRIAEIRANAEIEKQGASRNYQKFVDSQTEKEIREATQRHQAGGSVYKINTAQDAHQMSALLSATMAGKPVEGNSIDGTERGRTAALEKRRQEVHRRSDAEFDAVMREYDDAQRHGKPLWKTRYFLDCTWEGRQNLLKIWAEHGIPVPVNVLKQYGLKPAEAGAMFVSTTPAAGPAGQPAESGDRVEALNADVTLVRAALQAKIDARDGQNDYWTRCLAMFDQEIRSLNGSMPVTSMTGDEFRAVRRANVERAAHYERIAQRLEYWASVANGSQTIDVRTPEEIAEQVRQFVLTQGLFDQFVKAYVPAQEMLNTDEPFETKKEYVMKAVTAINAFGSHLFRNVRGTKVPDDIRQTYHDNALKSAKAIYGEKHNDEIEKLQVPADEEGIQKLLAMRSDLLGTLAMGNDDEVTTDINTHNWHLNAVRAERRYLSERDPASDRIDVLDENEEAAVEQMQTLLSERTNELDVETDDPATVLDAASKELYFLKTNVPDSDRIDELDNRVDEEDDMGLIQKALTKLHEPMKKATDARLTGALTDPEQIRAALQDLRAEGHFLSKHRGTMALGMEARVEQLVGVQGELSVNLAVARLNAVDKNDTNALGAAITELSRELAQLESHPANKEKAGELRTLLSTMAMTLRSGVNRTIHDAKTATDADPRNRATKIDQALYAINGEIDTLTSLSLDPERIANLRAETSLLDQRVALRESSEKELQIGTHALPEIESFRRVFGMLQGEANAIRMAYAKDPEKQQQKLDALSLRKAALRNTVDATLAAGVARLNDDSTIADVDRASALLRASLQMELGIVDSKTPTLELASRLPKPADFSQAKAAYEKIEAARARAVDRVRQFTIDAAAQQAARAAAEPMPTPTPLQRQSPPSGPVSRPREISDPLSKPAAPQSAPEPMPASVAAPEAPKPHNEKRASMPVEELSHSDVKKLVADAMFELKRNDAFLTNRADPKAVEVADPAHTAVEIRAKLETLTRSYDDLYDLRQRLIAADRAGDAFIIETFENEQRKNRELLLRGLQDYDMRIDTPESIAEAARTFLARYRQWRGEIDINASRMLAGQLTGEVSGVDGGQLKADLIGDGSEPKLLAKALEKDIEKDIIGQLNRAATYLDSYE